MLRLVDLYSRTSTGIVLRTRELRQEDLVPYVVYDTSTGITNMNDYYAWRSLTYKTSTGDNTGVNFEIENSVLYPSYGTSVTNYNSIDLRNIKSMTLEEYMILKNLLIRIDLVRRRFPNPGTTIEDVDGVGDRGVVSFAGGWDKKFSVDELFTFIDGSLVEINIHPPATTMYWNFSTVASDIDMNPYNRSIGMPYKITDLIVQGALIRALISWGLLEVDVHFTTSDSGLSITYDRGAQVQSWYDKLLVEYKSQKDFIKWDFVNSYGVGVGSMPFAATGIIASAMSMISGGTGVIPMNSLLSGFAVERGNVPM